MVRNNLSREAFFEMVSQVDFMMDDELNVYLMEADKSLNLNCGDVLKRIKNSDDFYAHQHVIS